MKPERDYKRWTNEEKTFVVKHWRELTIVEIARQLGRSHQSIRWIGIRMELGSPIRTRKKKKWDIQLNGGVSYKKALPPDQWEDAERFISIMQDLKRLCASKHNVPALNMDVLKGIYQGLRLAHNEVIL